MKIFLQWLQLLSRKIRPRNIPNMGSHNYTQKDKICDIPVGSWQFVGFCLAVVRYPGLAGIVQDLTVIEAVQEPGPAEILHVHHVFFGLQELAVGSSADLLKVSRAGRCSPSLVQLATQVFGAVSNAVSDSGSGLVFGSGRWPVSQLTNRRLLNQI